MINKTLTETNKLGVNRRVGLTVSRLAVVNLSILFITLLVLAPNLNNRVAVAGPVQPPLIHPAAKRVVSPKAKPGIPVAVKGSAAVAAVHAPSPATSIKNPFTIAYNVKALEDAVPPVSSYIPFVQLAVLKPVVKYSRVINVKNGPPPVDVTLGRVSGIIISGGVHAIYEADGTSTILQPGDALPDGAGRVIAINPTSIVVRISGNRYVEVEVSGSQNQQQGAGNGGPSFTNPQTNLNGDNNP